MNETGENDFDIDSAVNSIADDLDLSADTNEDNNVPNIESKDNSPTVEQVDQSQDQTQAPIVKSAPSSWAKEHHETWSKLDPKAQDYISLREEQMLKGLDQYKNDSGFGRQLREITYPYKQLLTSQGVDEPKAVQYLLNAHYRLSTLPENEKLSYLSDIAKSYGIDLKAMLAQGAQPGQQQVRVDPIVSSLQDKINKIESSLTQKEHEAQNAVRTKVSGDVEKFATDPAHPYFDEVSDEIVALIRHGAPLQDAYEKAVWANPVTRAKEISRMQAESETKLKIKFNGEGKKALKASSANVRGRDTSRAPTESLGTMDDTLKEALASIKSRVH